MKVLNVNANNELSKFKRRQNENFILPSVFQILNAL